jgi:molybdate transport system ATP-binding protein
VSVSASCTVRRGTFELTVDLEVSDGEVVVVVGPNGAGKSTLLRLLAGLLPATTGRVALDDEVVDDGVAGILVPPERRRCGVVFQDGLLFPHLSVLENAAFGLRRQGVSRAEARRRAQGWLDAVGVGDLAAEAPERLSGGQAQRAALARALASGPRHLLLDEPTSALDVEIRAAVRGLLAEHLGSFGGSCVVVSHDPADARAVADRLVVLEAGRVVQDGPVADVLADPATTWTAHHGAPPAPV